MKDISNLLGFDVKIKSPTELEFGPDIDQSKPDIRFEDDLKDLTYKKDQKLKHEPIYYMYRDRHKKADRENIRKNKLRYDITLVPPRMIGSEFIKTSGHFHPEKKGTKVAYPEVYEVISGQALYLLIGSVSPYDKVTEIYLCVVNSGEKAIMPPNFGHVTINVKNEPLLMTNWVVEEFSSVYDPIEEKHGGTHFIVKKQETRNKKQTNSKFKIIKNQNWGRLPDIQKVKPKSLPKFGLKFGEPMYTQGIKNPEKLDYLKNPDKYMEETKPDNVFE